MSDAHPIDDTMTSTQAPKATPDPAADRYARHAVLVILIAAMFRAMLIPVFPPGPDECSYWDWARRLDLSYVDHPPMVAYFIRASMFVFGDTVWAPRLFAVPLAAAAAWTIFLTARRLFGNRSAFWSATLYTCCPMFTTAAGLLLIPESILAFWMALGLYLVAVTMDRDQPRWLLAIGVVLGLALLTKYPGILLLLGLGLFALLSNRYRYWFARPESYAMVVIAAILFAPVIYWNVQHNWAGLGFLTRRTEALTGSPGWDGVIQCLIGQAAYHSPIIFLILIIGVIVALIRGLFGGDQRFLMLFCFSGPVVIAFAICCAYRETLPHWPAAGYIAAYIAAPAALIARLKVPDDAPRRWAVTALSIGAIVGAAASLLVPALLLYPMTTVAYKKWVAGADALPTTVEPMAETWGWDKEVRDRLLSIRDRVVRDTGEQPIVLTHYHLLAALIRRATVDDQLDTISLHHDAYQYDIWYSDADVGDKPVIYVSSDNNQFSRGTPEQYYQFAECQAEPPLDIIRHGVKINEVRFWVCSEYGGSIEQDPSGGDAPSDTAPPIDHSNDDKSGDTPESPSEHKEDQ